MTGHIHFDVMEQGVAIECKLEEVSILDKIMLVNGMLNALEIDTSNIEEAGMICAMACAVGNKAQQKISVDGNALAMLKALKEKHKQEAETEGEG